MISRIVVVGGGKHSRINHLPSLVRYAENFPNEIELLAFCDLDPKVADEVKEDFGFAKAYTDIGEMLQKESPDGCIAITPRSATAGVAGRIISSGIPLLMEKPLGDSMAEARKLVDLVERTQARVMVSMNRRFDPALHAAIEWKGNRQVDYIRVCMVRHDRRESYFATGTMLHVVDTIRMIAGDIDEHSIVFRGSAENHTAVILLRFQSGVSGILEIFPAAGNLRESYTLFGPDYQIEVDAGMAGTTRMTSWENGKPASQFSIADSEPEYVQNGTYAESSAFINALKEKHSFYPAPKDVLPSMDFCHSIEAELNKGL